MPGISPGASPGLTVNQAGLCGRESLHGQQIPTSAPAPRDAQDRAEIPSIKSWAPYFRELWSSLTSKHPDHLILETHSSSASYELQKIESVQLRFHLIPRGSLFAQNSSIIKEKYIQEYEWLINCNNWRHTRTKYKSIKRLMMWELSNFKSVFRRSLHLFN